MAHSGLYSFRIWGERQGLVTPDHGGGRKTTAKDQVEEWWDEKSASDVNDRQAYGLKVKKGMGGREQRAA